MFKVEAVATLEELRSKARTVTENPKNFDPFLVVLIEDLVRVAEKIAEEARKENQDFKQQVSLLIFFYFFRLVTLVVVWV